MSDLPTFEIERVFAAPVATVWRAWTEPHLLARWYGPPGCRVEVAEFALEPGGVCHHWMDYGQGPKWGRFEYVDVDAPNMLRWRHMMSDEAGNATRHPMMPDWPLVLMTTIEFTPKGDDATHVKLSWTPVDATAREVAVFEESMEKNGRGWGMGFDNLERLFAADLPAADFNVAGRMRLEKMDDAALRITRRFSAPKEVVYKAFTDGAIVAQWMTGPGDQWRAEVELDVRPGGKGRYVWIHSDGRSMGMNVQFDEVDAPHRLEHSELFDEDWTGGGTRVTTLFEETSGSTMVTMLIRYSSAEVRDKVMQTPMAWGMEAGYEKLEAMLTR